MLFMVIERFKDRDARAVYERARAKGRMLPAGVSYVDSWVETNYDRCFQLMESDAAERIQAWTTRWDDLVSFEIVPVISSEAAAKRWLDEKT